MQPNTGAGPNYPISPDSFPLINREDEQAILAEVVADPGRDHLHMTGPRGSGKTLLAQYALTTLAEDTGHYVHCTNYDTQYKVLKHLYESVHGEPISTGYHTSQLQDKLADLFDSRDTVIVLDELDFLLHNDGPDLLYYLTRIADSTLSVITISANHYDLARAVGGRIYSSLQPRTLRINQYSQAEATKILSHRLRHAHLRNTVDRESLSAITTDTTNIRLALHWAAEALTAADDIVTAETIQRVRTDTLYRYWDTLLSDFTSHHNLLIEALLHLTADDEHVHTGAVYDQYDQLCSAIDIDAFTPRRLSDFLKHLELLNIVEADYQYGGPDGKTRRLRLQEL